MSSSEYEDFDYDSDNSYNSSSSYIDDEEDMDQLRDTLKLAAGFNHKRKKGFVSRTINNKALDPELRDNLSRANEAFASDDLSQAKQLYTKVLELDANNSDALKQLADISGIEGDPRSRCRYLMRAALITRVDAPLWDTVAELSLELGYVPWAIKAYTRIISLKGKNRFQYIYKRAMLYKAHKVYGRALDGFRKLHQYFPLNSQYLKEVAGIYVEQKRTGDAIKLYVDILDRNLHRNAAGDTGDKKVLEFGFQELNILCELYIAKHDYRPAIAAIKVASRFIQGRSDEARFWEEADNDAEFDERRLEVLRGLKAAPDIFQRDYDLPVDIRYKLGFLRLELNDKDEAMRHFQKLFDEEDVSDLLFEAGKALEGHGYYQEALGFLSQAVEADEMSSDVELFTLLAKCSFEVKNYEEAKELYEAVLNASPNDISVKLSLAEALYYNGEKEKSKTLIDEVAMSQKKVARITNEMDVVGSSKKERLTDEQIIANDERARRKVLDIYKRMIRLEQLIKEKDDVAMSTWMQLASQLIELFTAEPGFFPKDKTRLFKGIVLYRRKKPLEIHEQLARAQNLHDGFNGSRLVHLSAREFRGLDYDVWFRIFVQYALFLKSRGDLDYGSQILEIALDVSVFVQDKVKEATLKLVRLVFGIVSREYSTTVLQHIRYFLLNNQFSPFVYKFFLCCFASGYDAWDTFSNYNHQKYLLRQLKAYDSLLRRTPVSGMATISADTQNIKFSNDPAELLYIYATLLGGNRSNISSIVYLNRAYKQYNRDPMICLTLGISHVQRSMQRMASNRHIQLLQGMSFIMEYRELRLMNASVYEQQEVEFNLGRVFHMIGLVTEAVDHYNKVLEFVIPDSRYDLAVDAAYNLALMYNVNGNSSRARALTEKYLTV